MDQQLSLLADSPVKWTIVTCSLVLTIFNKGGYLTFKSIFHWALKVWLWNHALIRSWNQPVLQWG